MSVPMFSPTSHRCTRPVPCVTHDDHDRAAQAKRETIRHIGVEAPKRPLPFGRASRWKWTLSGKIIPRGSVWAALPAMPARGICRVR